MISSIKIFIIVASVLLAILINHYALLNNMNKQFDKIDSIELNILEGRSK